MTYRDRLTRPPRWGQWTKERMTLETMRKLLKAKEREDENGKNRQ